MIKKILGVTISLLLLATLLVPIIGEYTDAGTDTLDVVILGGQSNAEYRPNTPRVSAAVANEEIPVPSTNCYYFGTDAYPITPNTIISDCSIQSMITDGAWKIGGEEAPIASKIASVTNDDVLVINVAIPGTAIAKFVPTSEYGERIISVIDAALNQVPDHYRIVKCGWVWIQGEADRNNSVQSYIFSFGLINEMMKAHGFGECFLVETRPSDSGNATEAQHIIADTTPNVKLASTAPASFSVADGTLVEGNEIHYTQKGRNIVGNDVGGAIAATLPHHSRTVDSNLSLLEIVPIIVIVALIGICVLLFPSRRD